MRLSSTQILAIDLKSVIRRLFLGRLMRSIGLLTGGMAVAQLLVVLLSPLVTRLYVPADFGVLSAFVSVTALMSVVNTLRYHQAIPMPVEDESAISIVILCFGIVGITTAIFSIGLFTLGPSILQATDLEILQPYLWLMPITAILLSSYEILSLWTVRKKQFGRLAVTKITQGAGLASTQLLFGAFKLGPLGLLAGDIAGRCLAVLPLARGLWRDFPAQARLIDLGRTASAAKRYRRFPLLSLPADILTRMANRMPAILILSFYGPQVAGWFAFTDYLLRAPLTLLGHSIGKVYFAEAASLRHSDPSKLKRLFRTTSVRLLLLGIVPLVLLILLGPVAFKVVFGESWQPAGEYARLLSLGILLKFVASPVSQTLNVCERQDLQLAWEVLFNCLVLGGIIGSYLLNLSAYQMILIYGIAMATGYLVYTLIIWWCVEYSAALNEPATS